MIAHGFAIPFAKAAADQLAGQGRLRVPSLDATAKSADERFLMDRKKDLVGSLKSLPAEVTVENAPAKDFCKTQKDNS